MTETQLRYEKNMRKAKERENEKLVEALTDSYLTNKLLWGALVIESLLVLVLTVVLINA